MQKALPRSCPRAPSSSPLRAVPRPRTAQRRSALCRPSSDLATYRLPHHSSVGHHAAAPWFQRAIKEAVTHLQDAPFLQLVQFNGDSTGTCATMKSFGVPDVAVNTPELWASISEAVTADTADVVLLVQRVDDSKKVSLSSKKLASSGISQSVFQGKVGDCCEKEGHLYKESSRRVVKVHALPPPEVGKPLSGYWGVVVQSKRHTGAEGCYLLKAVKETVDGTCSCTHFSLTRICRGENVESQFIKSWLAV